MNPKAAAAKRAVTLKRIKRVKGRLMKFQYYLNEIIAEIDFFERSVYICNQSRKYDKSITMNVEKGVVNVKATPESTD